MTLLVPLESQAFQRNWKHSLLCIHTYSFIYLFKQYCLQASGDFSYINCLCAQIPPIINLQVSLITAYSHRVQVEGYQLWWLNTTHIMWFLFTLLSLNLASKTPENSHQQSFLFINCITFDHIFPFPFFLREIFKDSMQAKARRVFQTLFYRIGLGMQFSHPTLLLSKAIKNPLGKHNFC